MIRNFWKNIHFLCGNHGEEIAMEYHEGADDHGRVLSGFYSCPKYYPQNRRIGESACFNRMTVQDCEDFVEALSRVLDEGRGIYVNPQGFVFRTKSGVEFTVLGQTNSGINVSVLNKRVIQRG